MKNLIRQDPVNITVLAPYAVASGGGVQIGAVFGVASTDAASGQEVVLVRRLEATMPKATGEAWVAWTTLLYWDNTNKRLTSTATSNKLVGVASAAALAAATSGAALLTGQLA